MAPGTEKIVHKEKSKNAELNCKVDDKAVLKGNSMDSVELQLAGTPRNGLDPWTRSGDSVKEEHPEMDTLVQKLEAIKISYLMRIRIKSQWNRFGAAAPNMVEEGGS